MIINNQELTQLFKTIIFLVNFRKFYLNFLKKEYFLFFNKANKIDNLKL
jgi:hypothetical protein